MTNTHRHFSFSRTVDRLLSKPIARQLGYFAIVVIVIFLFLFFLSLIVTKGKIDLCDSIFHFLNPANFFGNEPANKIMALIIGFFGMILLSGLLIPIVNNAIASRVKKIQNGQVSYHFNDHYLIIGIDRMTASIIKQMCNQMRKDKKEREIVVQTAKNVRTVRHQLEIDLDKEERERLIFMSGASNSQEDLQKLCIQNARRIVILGDDGNESHDVLNMQCWWQIFSLLKEQNSKRLECDVLFNDQSTFVILQRLKPPKRNDSENKIYFRPFNFCETWAQKVIINNKATIGGNPVEYRYLDGNGIRYESDKSVHFVILGINDMGIALAIEAARTAHFPNFIKDPSKKTRITLIDPDAGHWMNFFIARYPHLFEVVDFDYTDTTQKPSKVEQMKQYKNSDLEFTDFLDIHFSFIKGNFASPEVRNHLIKWAQNDSTLLTIAVCGNTTLSTDIGLYLPPVVFSKQIPVFIQQKETSGLFTVRMKDDAQEGNKYKNVRPFGVVNECFSMDISEIEKRAMKIKWIYDTYYEHRYDYDKKELKLDAAQALEETKKADIDSEEKLQEKWQKHKLVKRWSDIYNAYAIEVKKRSFGGFKEMTEEDVLRLAEVEHNRWNVERLIFGFRATTRQENKEICRNKRKEYYKENELAHFDIRPYKALGFGDDGIKANEYDICLSECLPKIIRE